MFGVGSWMVGSSRFSSLPVVLFSSTQNYSCSKRVHRKMYRAVGKVQRSENPKP